MQSEVHQPKPSIKQALVCGLAVNPRSGTPKGHPRESTLHLHLTTRAIGVSVSRHFPKAHSPASIHGCIISNSAAIAKHGLYSLSFFGKRARHFALRCVWIRISSPMFEAPSSTHAVRGVALQGLRVREDMGLTINSTQIAAMPVFYSVTLQRKSQYRCYQSHRALCSSRPHGRNTGGSSVTLD